MHAPFEKKLRDKIGEEIKRLTEIISVGSSVEDHAQYRNLVGQIYSLKRVCEMCDEVNDDLSKTR